MIWVYFDASVLVKRYSSEEGTELVNELFHQLPVEQMTCAMIGILEIMRHQQVLERMLTSRIIALRQGQSKRSM